MITGPPKATDVASVSKVIHTDNQLQAGQFGKTAYTGWIRLSVALCVKRRDPAGGRHSDCMGCGIEPRKIRCRRDRGFSFARAIHYSRLSETSSHK